ncbi:MAG: hypothetical protein M9921_01420 [Fimbriimonadaceae bacterium]|nr:hypothetical protein [Fimbriimonadaceae bacterium]
MRPAKPLLALLALGVMFAVAADALTVDALLQEAAKHDGKPVTVTGKVVEFKQKTSRAGNKYFTLQLKGKSENLNVYGHGELTPAPKKDDRVEASGVFRREKKVQTFTVKNEVDVSPVEGKKYGVKILKE